MTNPIDHIDDRAKPRRNGPHQDHAAAGRVILNGFPPATPPADATGEPEAKATQANESAAVRWPTLRLVRD